MWETGVDYQVDPVMVADTEEEGEEKIDMSGVNVGDGKYFPGGPKCKFNGKVVDCVTYVSKSGGITAEILVEILKYFDSIDLFPRDTGITPLLLVDGHQSRLSPIFIDYINNDGHPWKVCLGVPYATSLWQQGDSSEHNGAFKVEWSREKADLLKWKTAHPLMGRSINAEDIMPLLSKTFHKTFGNVRNSKKAAADRGWNPLNRSWRSIHHFSLELALLPHQPSQSLHQIMVPHLPQTSTSKTVLGVPVSIVSFKPERGLKDAKELQRKGSQTMRASQID